MQRSEPSGQALSSGFFKLLEDRADNADARSEDHTQQKVKATYSQRKEQIIVRGSCNGKAATFFVDTGSTVSLVSKHFISHHGLANNIKPTKLRLQSFTSDQIKTHGEIGLEISLAGHTKLHRMIVTDLVDTHCLLGFDLMTACQLSLDMTEQCMRTPKGTAPFLKKQGLLKDAATVRCCRTTTIPPNTAVFLMAKGVGLKQDRSYTGFIEPKINLLTSQGLLVHSSLSHTDGRNIPVKVVNVNDEPVVLHKNKVLGNLHSVNDSCDAEVRRVTVVPNNLPEWRRDQHVNEIVIDEAKDTAEPWTRARLHKELKLDDIEDITPEERHQLKSLVWKYKDCFSRGPFDLGECKGYEADINLKPDYKHTWVPARPVPYLLRDEMDRQIAGLEKAGVIEKCQTKSHWNSPVFLVKKPHQPNKMRFVVDMRMVNSQSLPDDYQIPLIGHVTDRIAGKKWYSTFDCSQSFHQIKYSEKSKPMTAFTTSNGMRYWFRKMIMGHKTSSAQFCRIMSKIMECLPFEELIFFLDDLLLASQTVSQHPDRLEIVFGRLLAANMKLSPAKSHFLRKKCVFVGVAIDKDGLSITEERQKTLMDLKSPTNKKSLMSLLGFFGFNRRWIRHYSDLTHPMYQLLKKEATWKWTKECEENLQKLKQAVNSSVTLAVPDLYDRKQSYELTIDGSKIGLGAYLTQFIDGRKKVIGYFSKSVPPHKREWSQTKLELLSLFHALEHWRPYLKGTKFRVNTDCSALTHLDSLFSKKDPTLRRKIQAISEYDFEIFHIDGTSNTIADFLSRYPFKTKFKEASTQFPEIKEATNPPPKKAPDKSEEPKKAAATETEKEVSSTLLLNEDGDKATKQHTKQKDRKRQPVKKSAKKKQEPVATCNKLGSEEVELPEEKGATQPSVTAMEDDQMFPKGFFCKEQRKSFAKTAMKTVSLKPVPTKTLEEECICSLQVRSISEDSSRSVSASDTQVPDGPTPTTMATMTAVLLTAQQEDLILREVRGWLQANKKPESVQAHRVPRELLSYWKQFSLLRIRQDGLLERKWIPTNGQASERFLVCVPESKIEEILHLCHSTLVTNHPGIQGPGQDSLYLSRDPA